MRKKLNLSLNRPKRQWWTYACQLWEEQFQVKMQKHGCILVVMEVLSMLEHFCCMVAETFFSELTMNDMRGQGTVSCQEFGQFIGNSIVHIQIRLDPER